MAGLAVGVTHMIMDLYQKLVDRLTNWLTGLTGLFQSAFWGLMAGLAMGGTRMIMDLYYSKPACGEKEERPEILVDF